MGLALVPKSLLHKSLWVPRQATRESHGYQLVSMFLEPPTSVLTIRSINNNPFDPPRTLTREVKNGAPSTSHRDAEIISAADWPTFRDKLESAHNDAHSFIKAGQ